MKILTLGLVVALTGCLCFPDTVEIEDLEIGMSYETVIHLGEPYTEIRTIEPGHILKELRYYGGTVLTFRDDVLIKIEERR